MALKNANTHFCIYIDWQAQSNRVYNEVINQQTEKQTQAEVGKQEVLFRHKKTEDAEVVYEMKRKGISDAENTIEFTLLFHLVNPARYQ